MLLRRYIFAQLFWSSLWSFVMLTAVMFAGMGIQFTQRYAALGVGFLFEQLPGLLSLALPYSIAFGVLSGMTLTVGRMASEGELMIVAISGIPTRVLWLPAGILAIGVCVLSFVANHYWQPQGFDNESKLQVNVLRSQLERLPSSASTIDFPQFSLSYQQHRSGRFAGLTMLLLRSDGSRIPRQLVVARYGSIDFYADEGQIQFNFEDCYVTEYSGEWPPQTPVRQIYYRMFNAVVTPFKERDGPPSRIKAMDRDQLGTYAIEVSEGLVALENAQAAALHGYEVGKAGGMTTTEIEPLAEELQRATDDLDRSRSRLREADAEWYRRLALSIAPLTFMLLGMPMGLLVRQGNRLVAFSASTFVVAVVFYPLLMVSVDLAHDGVELLPPFLQQAMIVVLIPSLAILALAALVYRFGSRT